MRDARVHRLKRVIRPEEFLDKIAVQVDRRISLRSWT